MNNTLGLSFDYSASHQTFPEIGLLTQDVEHIHEDNIAVTDNYGKYALYHQMNRG